MTTTARSAQEVRAELDRCRVAVITAEGLRRQLLDARIAALRWVLRDES